MYTPEFMRMDDPEALRVFLRDNSFGILFSRPEAGDLVATHLPMLLAEDPPNPLGALIGHMAIGNTQWQGLDGQSVLAVFPGAHAYISPTWYERLTVPTWNYAAVHVYGTYHTTSEEVLWQNIRELVHRYEEPASPLLGVLDEDPTYRSRLKGVAGFRIEIERIEGKRKLNQNHPESTRRRVIEALHAQGRDDARQVADWMEETLGQVKADLS